MNRENNGVGTFFNRLQVRVVVLLSLVLLPFCLAGIIEARHAAKQARANAELALLVTTERAAIPERTVIREAVGAARMLGTLLPQLGWDSVVCDQVLSDFIAHQGSYSFVGVLPTDGVIECSSSDQTFDFADRPSFDVDMAAMQPTLTVDMDGPISGTSVIIVSEPFFDGDVFGGFVSISIPHQSLGNRVKGESYGGLVDLMTFNANGDLLTAHRPMDIATENFPVGLEISELMDGKAIAFSGHNRQGDDLIYTVAPIEAGTIYVMGIWDTSSWATNIDAGLQGYLLPLTMWLASIAIAAFSIRLLVTRHIRRLNGMMTRFAATRVVNNDDVNKGMPNELDSMQESFLGMANAIMRDEAKLEDAVHEKTVLIKEVHHRVKNNLQLISSIVNMQIRQTTDQTTRRSLRRIQDRVLSLATIHRDLYQSNKAGLVNISKLLVEIMERSIDIGANDPEAINLITNIDEVSLFPDQAVPFSLLASEAATNAMKYIGAGPSGEILFRVSLLLRDPKTCVFTIENSVRANCDSESTGVGGQLIKAFATQLGADITMEKDHGNYRLTLTFPVEEFQPEK